MSSRSENERDTGEDEYQDEYLDSDEDQDFGSDEEEHGNDEAEAEAEIEDEEESELRPMSHGRKRPATASPPLPPPRKRGRPKGSKNKPKATPKDSRAQGKQAAKKVKKLSNVKVKRQKETTQRQLISITYTRPRITVACVSAYVGPDVATFDANWTHADERAQGYEGSAEKRAISKMTLGSHGRQLTFWKVTDKTSMAVWDQMFCREFADIMSHHVWNGDIDVLVTLLQYTVICRTDDRRRWQVPTTMVEAGPTVRLRTELQTYLAPLPTSIHELHKDIRDNRSPAIIHCPLSNLMMTIAEVEADRRESGHYTRWNTVKQFHDGYEVYGVTIADLGIIKEAIEMFSKTSTEASFDAFKKINKLGREEVTIAQFRSLMRRAWLQEKRLIHCDKDSRRVEYEEVDEYEEVQDEVMSEVPSRADGRDTGASNPGEDIDPPTFSDGAEDDFDDGGYGGGYEGGFDDRSDGLASGDDQDMGDAPETQPGGDPRSELPEEGSVPSESIAPTQIEDEMLGEPSFIDTLQSTPPASSVHEPDHHHQDPDQPLQSVESSLGSTSFEPLVPHVKPLVAPPLNAGRFASGVGSAGFGKGVVGYRKARDLREWENVEAITLVLKKL
ncbi:uncharacterized protein BKA55DRAFT_539090 [Fusarium redolens]|uniref:Uncharacterized protein n=1 Tax=Fusarium redolens TaxID=48865 RepID=A0A9P9HCP6_FUSRE|nr:uncharacterized protein BKA55DRAFT_539090 [Fusarium redolens]KAH7254257.1 hypothetical protein BKA55DRAFT_539090 [Fusarium redolens]